jgi:hypothetical protein
MCRLALSLSILAVTAAQMPAQQVGPDAIWEPKPADLQTMRQQCQTEQYPNYSTCLLSKLRAAAPPAAASFMKWLDANTNNVGWLSGFRKTPGAVGIAYVVYPLRANSNQEWLFVNGQPPVVDVDDLQNLPKTEMERSPVYASIKKAAPDAILFPGDRGQSAGPSIEQLSGNQLRLTVDYYQQKCHACARLAIARFGFDFSHDGKFLGSRFLDLQPAAPPPR